MFEAGEEYVGIWWTPGKPDNKAPGLLEIDDRGGTRLRILGWFPEPFELGSTLSAMSLPAILGKVGSRCLTLWHSNLTFSQGDPRARWPEDQQPTQVFEAYQLLVGERHFPEPQEPCFTGTSLELSHLDAWCVGKVDVDDDRSGFRTQAQLKGMRLTVHGGAYLTHQVGFSGRRAQYGVDMHFTSPTSLTDAYFTWERPFISYLQLAVDEEVHVLRRTARTGRSFHDLVDVFTNGALPKEEPRKIYFSSLLMRLDDGLVQSRMRRWYELDRLAVHGLISLDMVGASSNRWTNNRVMNVAAAFDGVGRALKVARSDAPTKKKRQDVAKQLDPTDRKWFYEVTQHAARPSFAAIVRGLHAPVADATYPLLREADDWITRLTSARNGIAHALADHVTVSRDPRYEHFLAEVSRAVLLARLMHELAYPEAHIRQLFVENRHLRFVGEQWWQITHEATA